MTRNWLALNVLGRTSCATRQSRQEMTTKMLLSFSPANHPNVIAVSGIVDTDTKMWWHLEFLLIMVKMICWHHLVTMGNVVDIAAFRCSINSTYKSNSFATQWNKYGYTICNGSVALYLSIHIQMRSPSDVSNTIKNLGTTPANLFDWQR